MKYFKKLLIVSLMSLTVLSGCSLPGLGGGANDPVRITSLNTSESQIMAHMLRLLIENDTEGEIQPTIINNLGASTVQHNAVINGDANMSSTRYSGTELTGALGLDPIADSDEAMQVAQTKFSEQYDQKFFDSYGFDNSYAFMVSRETAEEYDLQTVSDLEEHTDELELGVDSSWLNREGDGYQGFVDHYGFDFDSIRPMQIGLVYDAIENNSLEVVLGYTSDGRISAYDLVVLEDDKDFFPAYDTSALATEELLEEYPEIEEITQKLSGEIPTEMMQQLNYQADGESREPAIIAEEFLEENNYFEDKGGGQ